MTITISAYAATATTISTVEWSMTDDSSGVSSSTAVGIYQAFIDLSALSSDDDFEFKTYETVPLGGTQRLVYSAYFSNAQATPNWVSPSLILGMGWDMTLTKSTTTATSQIIPWRISSIT